MLRWLASGLLPASDAGFIGGELLKTVARDNDKPIRNKHAAGTSPRA